MVTPLKSEDRQYFSSPAVFQDAALKRNHKKLALNFTALSDQLFGIHHAIL